MFGRLLAWMIAEPAAMAVTGTVTTFEPGEKLTVAGTVTALMLLEVRLTITPPAGAPADSVSVRFCVPVPVMVRLSGLKTTVAITCTAELAGVYPLAVALMFTAPKLTPVTVGCVPGADWPAAMVTLAVESVTLLLSLLASAMVTGATAGDDRVTGKPTVWPNPTLPLAGRLIVPAITTVTLVVAFAMPGATAVAVMVAEPAATAVSNTLTLVVFAGKLTLPGTVTALVLPEVRFTVRPLEGAGAERFSATFCVVIPVMVTVGDAKLIVAVTFTGALAAA
jgi:hypothetical protein